MSTSTLYLIYKTKARAVAEFRNSYGTASPEPLRIAHAFTFDRALCTPPNRDRLVKACLETGRVLADYSPDTVNHWGAIGGAVASLAIDARSLGFGLGGTSVNDPWESYPGNGEPWDMFGEGGIK